MIIERSQEWWVKRLLDEPEVPVQAGVPTDRDALWRCQQLAALGIEETNDTDPAMDLFVAIHRAAASALAAPLSPVNEVAP